MAKSIVPFVNDVEDDIRPILGRKAGSTVISLLPFALMEEKPHMLPAVFRVPAAEKGDIAILHVDEGIHYIPNPLVDEGKPGSTFRQVTSSAEMARSIVDDYRTSHISLGEGAEPGLFWVEHRLTKEEVKKYHADKIEEAKTKMVAWFNNLCSLADADWQRNHNMMAVSDLQRAAAKWLGIKREWVEFMISTGNLIACPYCKAQIAGDSIKCFNCKEVVNVEAYKAMQKGLGGVINGPQ